MSLSPAFATAGSKPQDTLRLRSHENQRLRSLIYVLFLTLVVLLSAIESRAQNEGPESTTLVDESYSLKADREAFEELRKNIPANVKKDNDEKAFMDGLVSDLSRTPSEVRGKFSSIVNKKRDLFNKDMTKAREQFGKIQKKERDEFTKDLADKRKAFAKTKSTSDERKEFYDEHESKRKDFYENQKEKRDQFEADMRDKRKNFDDYIRSKTDEFNQLHRDYTKRFEENKKALADQKKQAELKKKQQQQDLEKEYEAIRKQDPTILGPTGE
ncbi:hypothetical protein ACES2J_02930 [Bdellovibrio bacteriovorus]|uniref:hypothetical protein n=1 Tax=Bdellovibrio bacteriovorus TaxID=959 RepID=UPI0035A68447